MYLIGMVALNFKVTNNEAEYKAIVAGLGITAELGVIELETRVDLQVVVNQLLEFYTTKGKKLKRYQTKFWEICDLISHYSITQIPRSDNELTDRLAKVASGMNEVPLPWLVIKIIIEVLVIGVEVSVMFFNILEWARGVVEYLQIGKLLEVMEEARKI